MDQYLVNFEMDMLYFDLMQLIDLIKESGNEDLLPYTDYLQKVIDDETP